MPTKPRRPRRRALLPKRSDAVKSRCHSCARVTVLCMVDLWRLLFVVTYSQEEEAKRLAAEVAQIEEMRRRQAELERRQELLAEARRLAEIEVSELGLLSCGWLHMHTHSLMYAYVNTTYLQRQTSAADRARAEAERIRREEEEEAKHKVMQCLPQLWLAFPLWSSPMHNVQCNDYRLRRRKLHAGRRRKQSAAVSRPRKSNAAASSLPPPAHRQTPGHSTLTRPTTHARPPGLPSASVRLQRRGPSETQSARKQRHGALPRRSGCRSKPKRRPMQRRFGATGCAVAQPMWCLRANTR